MTQPLDPYHEWLGIPPEDQPPHYYQLLGISLFEPDNDVIRAAAGGRAGLVREKVSSETMALCRRTVNQIGKAERTLLDPNLRSEYDTRLRTKLGLDVTPLAPPPDVQPSPPTIASSDGPPPNGPVRVDLSEHRHGGAARKARRRRVQSDWRLPVFVGTAIILVIGGVFVVKQVSRNERTTSERPLRDASDEIRELTLHEKSVPKEPSEPVPQKTKPDVTSSPSPDPNDVAPRADEAQPTEPTAKRVPDKRPVNVEPHAQGGGRNDAEMRPPAPVLPVRVPPVTRSPPVVPPAQPEASDVTPEIAAEDRSVPANDLLKAARKHIKKEFSPWPTDSKERLALVTKLIHLSEDRTQGRARQYVLLEQAGLIATRAGNLGVAWQSLDQLCGRFDVDRIRLRASLLIPFAKTAAADDVSGKMLSARFLQVLDDAIRADRFDIAPHLLDAIGALATRWQDGALIKAWGQHAGLVGAGKKHFKRIARAKEILKDTPTDPAANRTLGEFYAYVANNWSRGAVYLRQCDDPELKKAAMLEIDILGGIGAKTEVGKAWLKVASKIKGKQTDAKRAVQMRARYWLVESWRESEGDARKAVEAVMTDGGMMRVNSIGMRLMRIPAGSFIMGSPKMEEGREKNKLPIEQVESRIVETEHPVRLNNDYYMGMFEVTQAQFFAVMGKNPSDSGKEGQKPVENVSWPLAATFCKQLRTKENGTNYRLPTEAEWEYACRAGTRTAYYFGGAITKDQAAIRSDGPVEVGLFAPNAFGLFDMHGNVSEWVFDRFQPGFYRAATNPVAVTGTQFKAPRRFIRGGGFNSPLHNCRSAARVLELAEKGNKSIGFRVVVAPR